LITAVIGAAFALLVQSSGDWRVGLPWERALLLKIDRSVPSVVDRAMLGLPWLGTNLTLFPIVSAVSLWLWRKKARGELALQLMVTVVGSLILNAVLKDVFGRPRPDLWPHRGQYQWSAYPSGHAIAGVAVFFTIARMLHRQRGWRWPFAVAGTLLVVNLYSRLFLGVHWPTDVIGGLIVGLTWLCSTEYAFAPFAASNSVNGVRPATDGNPTSSARRSSIEGAGA
jgi:undecaprenyl-diphosphatase